MRYAYWNPVRRAVALNRALSHLLHDEKDWSVQDSGERIALLPVDVFTTDEALILQADIPGAKPEDVEIKVEGDTLTIRGEVPAGESADYVLRERYAGKFARILRLNVPVDQAKVEASFANGILTLTLPKTEESLPHLIKVQRS
jgi:HSP20 family protein